MRLFLETLFGESLIPATDGTALFFIRVELKDPFVGFCLGCFRCCFIMSLSFSLSLSLSLSLCVLREEYMLETKLRSMWLLKTLLLNKGESMHAYCDGITTITSLYMVVLEAYLKLSPEMARGGVFHCSSGNDRAFMYTMVPAEPWSKMGLCVCDGIAGDEATRQGRRRWRQGLSAGLSEPLETKLRSACLHMPASSAKVRVIMVCSCAVSRYCGMCPRRVASTFKLGREATARSGGALR